MGLLGLAVVADVVVAVVDHVMYVVVGIVSLSLAKSQFAGPLAHWRVWLHAIPKSID